MRQAQRARRPLPATRAAPATLTLLTCLAVLTPLSGCLATPEPSAERALYLDLRRIVETRQRTGWVIDRHELDAIAPVAMRSLCRVEPPARLALARWLEAAIADAGGPAADAYTGDLDAVEDTLTLERVLALVHHANHHAADDCPFWLTPDPDFDGVQVGRDRFLILIESRGQGQLLMRAGVDPAFGGGGGGRLLPAWGFGDTLILGLGAELGGGGAFSLDENGEQQVEAVFSAAVPLLIRFQDASRLYDIELAVPALFTPSDPSFNPGARVAFGLGLSAVRIGPFLPTAILQVGYEYHPSLNTDPPPPHPVLRHPRRPRGRLLQPLKQPATAKRAHPPSSRQTITGGVRGDLRPGGVRGGAPPTFAHQQQTPQPTPTGPHPPERPPSRALSPSRDPTRGRSCPRQRSGARVAADAAPTTDASISDPSHERGISYW